MRVPNAIALLISISLFPNSSFGQLRPNAFTVYGGLGSPTPLPELVRARALELTSDNTVAAAYSRQLNPESSGFVYELEGNLSSYLGAEDRQEPRFAGAGAFVFRWKRPPWNGFLQSTLGIGNGISYANSVPELERELLTKTSRWLYHLMFEVTFARPSWDEWEAVLRIHHRSGVFGLIDGITGGSDFLCLGIKRRW